MATVRWNVCPVAWGGSLVVPKVPAPPPLAVGELVETGGGVHLLGETFPLAAFRGRVVAFTESRKFAYIDFGHGIYQWHGVAALRRV